MKKFILFFLISFFSEVLFSQTYFYTGDIPVPERPVIIKPETGERLPSNYVDVIFTPSPFSDRWFIQLATDSGFTTMIYNSVFAYVEGSIKDIPDIEYIEPPPSGDIVYRISDLQFNQIYWLRLQQGNEKKWSGWNEKKIFIPE